MDEKSQKWTNNTPIEALGHGEDKSKHGFQYNTTWREIRTKMQMTIKLIFQISCSIFDQIAWDKVYWIQHARLYNTHGKELKNKRFEKIPNWWAVEDSATLLLARARTDEYYASMRWMLENFELSDAWRQPNHDLPLLVVGENRTRRCSYSKDLMLVESSKWCPGHETSKKARGALGVLSRNCQYAKMQERREWMFLCMYGFF